MKIFKSIFIFLFVLLLIGCVVDSGAVKNLTLDDGVLTWDEIADATYTIQIIYGGEEFEYVDVEENAYTLPAGQTIEVSVCSVIDGVESKYSKTLTIHSVLFEDTYSLYLDNSKIVLPNEPYLTGFYNEEEEVNSDYLVTSSFVLTAKYEAVITESVFEAEELSLNLTVYKNNFHFSGAFSVSKSSSYKIYRNETLLTSEFVYLDLNENVFSIEVSNDYNSTTYTLVITYILYEAKILEAVGFNATSEFVYTMICYEETFDFSDRILVSPHATYTLMDSDSMKIENLVDLVDGENRFIIEVVCLELVVTYEFIITCKSNTDSIDRTIDVLNELYNDYELVNKDISLLTYEPLFQTNIYWTSNNNEVLDETGKYTRPYVKQEVVLTAKIIFNDEEKEVNYTFTCDGYKELKTGNITSGYQYTNYNLLTDEFFEILDILYCAFGLVDTNGDLLTSNSTKTCLANIKNNVTPRAKLNGNWVVLSIGGGGQSGSFGTIAADDAKRKNFANNIVSLINEYDLDGVDIDWETPTAAQATTYTLLMKEVYTQVKANNPHHLVTTAITGGKWQPPRYDLINSIKYIDYVNLMTYGLVNNNMQYQNALYKSTNGRTLSSCSIDESIPILTGLGVPKSKLIVGLAFYGIVQKKSGTTWSSSGSTTYTTIVNSTLKNANYKEYYDEECDVPYIMNLAETEFISYDNPRSIIAKCKYTIDNNLGGVMYWQNGQDTTGQLLQAIKTGFNK